jgi:hypothetical protein
MKLNGFSFDLIDKTAMQTSSSVAEAKENSGILEETGRLKSIPVLNDGLVKKILSHSTSLLPLNLSSPLMTLSLHSEKSSCKICELKIHANFGEF